MLFLYLAYLRSLLSAVTTPIRWAPTFANGATFAPTMDQGATFAPTLADGATFAPTFAASQS